MDISMCKNDKCERCKDCFRYMAKAGEYQTYADFEAKDCDYFMEIYPKIKYNNGKGAILCVRCNATLKINLSSAEKKGKTNLKFCVDCIKTGSI